MKKVIVIGCPRSGKSTFLRALHNKMGVHLYHLDMMYSLIDKYKDGKTVVVFKSREQADAFLNGETYD